MFIYKMPNYPGFYRKSYISRHRHFKTFLHTRNITSLNMKNDDTDNLPLLKHPCEYFILSVFLTIWFGAYVRRKLYYMFYK